MSEANLQAANLRRANLQRANLTGTNLAGTDLDGADLTDAISFSIEFVQIPAGEFQMGAEEGGSNERPVHTVRLSQPFDIGKYPVTQGQWQAVMGKNPSHFTGDLQRPVENVSWNDIQAFLQALNTKEPGNFYRLPTEAEWEYACRAGTTTAYSFGDDVSQLGEYAWYRTNSGNQTHPAGQKLPNAWGIYDMHGNVWEWVQDWYGAYEPESVIDPLGPPSGSRVVRGGSFDSSPEALRSAVRVDDQPLGRPRLFGFRFIRVSPQP